MPTPEEMSRDELIALVTRQAEQIASQDTRIARMVGQVAELMEANEALAAKLSKLEHLLSRNSGNSSNPSSKDDGPGKTPPKKKPRPEGPVRPRGGQRGAAGASLEWTNDPDEKKDQFPEGACECGAGLAGAKDLGVVDRYQPHEFTDLLGDASRVGTGVRKVPSYLE